MARNYTDEFKASALQYLRDHPDLDKREVAKKLDVPYDTLYGWYKKDRRENKPNAYDEAGKQTPEEREIIQLKRELRDTQDALEVLKKAISILGK